MSAGRHDPSPATGAKFHGLAPGLASACVGAAVAVVIASWWGRPGFVVVAAGLAGGSVGAALSVAVGRCDRRLDRGPADDDAPWFHRVAAAGALGIAAAIVLGWGAVLEATIPGYGAATSAGLLSYALLGSTVPRW